MSDPETEPVTNETTRVPESRTLADSAASQAAAAGGAVPLPVVPDHELLCRIGRGSDTRNVPWNARVSPALLRRA